VAYRVDSDKVAAEVAQFSGATLRHWKACLVEIAIDPFPRFGLYVERVLPIPPLPMRTYVYEITEETSVSGEKMFVLVAEFFPEYAPVYVVNHDESEVDIFYLRPRR
jgi:hypothetical protein